MPASPRLRRTLCLPIRPPPRPCPAGAGRLHGQHQARRRRQRTGPITVSQHRRRLQGLRRNRSQRQPHLLREERGRRGHRVLSAGRGRPADHRRSREHRPGHQPQPGGHRSGRQRTSPRASPAWSATASVRLRRSRTPAQRQPSTPTSRSSLTRPRRPVLAYVKDQTEQLIVGTKAFAEAFAAGDADKARDLYAATRMHWERIEPVAESFGDLDPKLDVREADLQPGEAWTGWHRAEKDLFPPAGYTAMTAAERTGDRRPSWWRTPKISSPAPALWN